MQKLVQDFPDKSRLADAADWLQKAADLDKYYIPTRYPNGLPDLTPHEVYSARDSESALAGAAWLVTAAGNHLHAV